jgi:formylglycine-generating enzyme required for sulfatase activity
MNCYFLSLIFFLIISIFACNKNSNTPVSNENKNNQRTPAAGESRIDLKGIEQVYVPPGIFMMGTNDEEKNQVKSLNPPAFVIGELSSEQPKHEVQITYGYWIDKYEVTNDAYQAFVNDSGYYKLEYWSAEGKKWLSTKPAGLLPINTGKEVANLPRVLITWYEAQAYANWRGGRLPLEAEWEFAARGPKSNIYPWGNTFDSKKVNVIGSSGLTPVGNSPDGASWIGALDMAGNAMEWVNDWLDTGYYKNCPHDNPPGPATGTIKIEKGGWWGSNFGVARSAYRHFEDPPTYGDKHIGFRIVSTIK